MRNMSSSISPTRSSREESSLAISLSLRDGKITHDPNIRVTSVYNAETQMLRLEIQFESENASATSRVKTHNRHNQVTICPVLAEPRHSSSFSSSRRTSHTDNTFASLLLRAIGGSQEQNFEGCMDTGAERNVMSRTTATSLELKFENTAKTAPDWLIGFGNKKPDILGYVAVRVRTFCKAKYIIAWFYIVEDDAMVGKGDALLSCSLTRELGHIVRIHCPWCDS